MNTVAGGGSFLSFPALIASGIPSIPATATNSAAMWVGSFGSARGYWSDVRPHKRLLYSVLAISVIGSLIGACLLIVTPAATFNRLIPWLLLFATVVFAVSPYLAKPHAQRAPEHQSWQLVLQFVVAVYGGYFGAGMGILMLAILAFTGLPTFNATNGMKNVLSVAINGCSLVPFLWAHIIDWRFAIPMCMTSLIGGYMGAKFFRRVPAGLARGMVIITGIAMTAVFFFKH